MKKLNLISYKLLALIPFMMLAGCKKFEHKNVIKNITKIDSKPSFFLIETEDVETGTNKICKFSSPVFDYLLSGDTIVLVARGTRSNECYKANNIIWSYGTGVQIKISHNSDSIFVRRMREMHNNRSK